MKLLLLAIVSAVAQTGFLVQESNFSVQETIDRLELEINALPPVNVALRVDHQAAAAARVGLRMNPNTVLMFGNPLVGTPIMAEQQSAGIDLPLKVSSWEDDDGVVFVGYSDPVEWIGPRHEVVGQQEVLGTMSGLLSMITARAAGNPNKATFKKPVNYFESKFKNGPFAEGLIAKTSPFTVSETIANLTQALLPTPIEVQLRVDHAAAAGSVGLFLRPTEALIFGNPLLGTLLMQSEPEIGFDLPLKAAAFEDENGVVWLVYNDIEYLADRFDIFDQAQTVITISQALRMFTDVAVGN